MNQRQLLVMRKLREIQESDGLSVEHLEEIVAPALELESTETEAAGSRTPTVTSEAIDSWRRFERGDPLDERDLFHLESIILPNGARPAFDIQGDSFASLPSLWQDINNQRSLLEPLIRGIGRVELVGHPERTIAGTAFVCGARRLMTNRHVAALFTQGVGAGAQLQFTPGIGISIDLKEEVGSSASLILEVTAPALIIEEWDIAILETSELPAGVIPLPLSTVAPSQLEERLAMVVGYPAQDPSESSIQQNEIFRSVFDKKRLQPGRLKGFAKVPSFERTVNALAHDCTTLGGNSGSAVIDITSARVVGIHFDGQPLVANFAVPTWELATDHRVTGAGVDF